MADFARVPHFTRQVAAMFEFRALEGDPPVELHVMRFVNNAHSASSHFAQNVEAPVEDVARLAGVGRLFPFHVVSNLVEEPATSAAGFAQVALALLARPRKRRIDQIHEELVASLSLDHVCDERSEEHTSELQSPCN